uniref:Uncharacterized protein n=1 Tax=Romanomermis culicivorax TaxID=13658 RepID=A0A915JI68_ROMCU
MIKKMTMENEQERRESRPKNMNDVLNLLGSTETRIGSMDPDPDRVPKTRITMDQRIGGSGFFLLKLGFWVSKTRIPADHDGSVCRSGSVPNASKTRIFITDHPRTDWGPIRGPWPGSIDVQNGDQIIHNFETDQEMIDR